MNATEAVIQAAEETRFTLHCVLLGADARGDTATAEVAGETLSELQRALVAYHAPAPPPPICSGCSPLTVARHGFDEGFWRRGWV